MNIIGKVAIVSGAASGIGRATAVALAKAGARAIAIADVDRDGLAETGALIEAAGAAALQVEVDVANSSDLERLYAETDEAFSTIDIVFNNAGIVSGPPPFPATSLQRIRTVIEIDLIAVVQSTALAIRYMGARGGGVVINTASTGAFAPVPDDPQYAVSKAGVVHLGICCAAFNQSHGVRVNSICPGVTETPILDKTGGGVRPDWLQPILEGIRVHTAEEIAEAVLTIVRDDTMVGQAIVIDNEKIAR